MPKQRIQTPTKTAQKKWIPHYACPICKEPVPPATTRPKIWHTECKPLPSDPKRSDRICPGCGNYFTLERTGQIGSPSAFCSDTCKENYKNILNERKNTKKCRTCQKSFAKFTSGTPRKQEICDNCFFENNPTLAKNYPNLKLNPKNKAKFDAQKS